ncbi:hypothetical protein M9H77_30339 [Catharanthus roseus]|uniref:Uncharacterized protein n=1 Tax=Catharanthus roseus TaxID=4058 RepID=A0ACB9ZY97_CATRO|nr:hypothetical protein M9H77_30339 [Catharanthus roseus]
MEHVICEFCGVSGQKISTEKSRLFVSPNVGAKLAKYLSKEFDIPRTADLGKYFGIPLLHTRVNKSTFSHVVGKVTQRLSGWKTRIMSQTAKSILIQTTTSAIPSYTTQTVKLPASIIEELERVNRVFFWGDIEGPKYLHSIAWPAICQPRRLGGIGLRRLKEANMVALCKLAWRCCNEKNSLWTQVLKGKYGTIVRYGVVLVQNAYPIYGRESIVVRNYWRPNAFGSWGTRKLLASGLIISMGKNPFSGL